MGHGRVKFLATNLHIVFFSSRNLYINVFTKEDVEDDV